MPKYKKKQTDLMDYPEFKSAIAKLSIKRQTFLTILFFSGVRVSEALALTPQDIDCKGDIIYVQFYRLKGSDQTDPTPLPAEPLYWLCNKGWSSLPKDSRIFDFSRSTAWRMVKRIWPEKYLHYFRMNRIVKISEKRGDAYVYSFVGITANAIDHYRGKVNIGIVGKDLQNELKF